jgi:NADH-quinone oxidoreductase subunit N
MIKYQFHNKSLALTIVACFSFYFTFFLIILGRYFSVNGSFLFDIVFLVVVILWILYACYLMFFSSFSKNEIAINLNFWLFIFFLFLLISLFVFAYEHRFYFGVRYLYFNNHFCIDSSTYFIRFWIIFFSLITTVIAEFFLINNKQSMVEFPLFLLMGSYILSISVCLVDIFSLLIVLESISFLIIGISILTFSKLSIEANLKYFVQNTIVTGLSVLGIFGIYFILKNTNFYILKIALNFIFFNISDYNILFILFVLNLWLLSILFKLGIFPLHFYVVDIYESAPFASIFFLSSVIKPSIFYILCKIYFIIIGHFSFFFVYLFIFIGFISMFIGNILAFGETKIKRFLGFTSVNQFGFLLICVSTQSIELVCFSFIYLFLYNIFFLSIIFVFVGVSTFMPVSTITNFSDIGFALQNETFLKLLMTLSLFSITGLPPLIVFIFKYLILYKLFLNFYYVIVLLIIVLNIISAVYYFKIIINIWVIEINIENLKYIKNNFNFFNFEYNSKFIYSLLQLTFIFICIVILILFKYFDDIFMSLMLTFLENFSL